MRHWGRILLHHAYLTIKANYLSIHKQRTVIIQPPLTWGTPKSHLIVYKRGTTIDWRRMKRRWREQLQLFLTVILQRLTRNLWLLVAHTQQLMHCVRSGSLRHPKTGRLALSCGEYQHQAKGQFQVSQSKIYSHHLQLCQVSNHHNHHYHRQSTHLCSSRLDVYANTMAAIKLNCSLVRRDV